ncbi:putative RNA-directed DNA polymerase [Helianthus annuus]|nr:putative RNA-directed DNA polymerase [Helianthus annuus]
MEDIYVEQPEGFEVEGKEHMVYKLKKALYGLKQAPRAWYEKIDTYFLSHGFKRSYSEPTLYVKVNEKGILYVCLYVDDIICTSSCNEMVTEFKQGMKSTFEMTDMGSLKYFLGLEVKQTTEGIFVYQGKYVASLLSRFGMSNCNTEDTPVNYNEKLQLKDGADKVDGEMYRSLVGGLVYLTHTRPDLAYAVNLVSRYMHQPSKLHLGAAKRIIKYVAGTKNFGIWYKKVQEIALVGYCDSDWASCPDDRKSLLTYVFTLGNGAVAWCSKKQHTMALSSTEAEYISATGATCEAI